jgi:F420-dependent oxidoreductase-like protein
LMTKPIRFGVQTAPQNTTWPELRDTWKLIDESGYDTAWTFDHFFPILSDPSGPCFEGWIVLAALAAETTRVQAGVLVTGNTYRNPAVLAKMGSTLDHSSGGRLIMGLGAGWFELEHEAYGISFPPTAERIRRLDEAAEIIRRLWSEQQTTFEGRYYQLRDAYCEPKPVQKPHPPIMIGGGGEKLTLRAVAKHADQWNTFGSPALFRKKTNVLRQHCLSLGRNYDEIEITWTGVALITGSAAEKEAGVKRVAGMFGNKPEEVEPGLLVGSSEEIRQRIEQFIQIGVTHFVLGASAPFDHETIRRFAEEIAPIFRSR